MLLVLVIHHEIWLRHGHGPLGFWCGYGSRVRFILIQGLIQRLSRVLPCDIFLRTSGREGHLPAQVQWQLLVSWYDCWRRCVRCCTGVAHSARTSVQLQDTGDECEQTCWAPGGRWTCWCSTGLSANRSQAPWRMFRTGCSSTMSRASRLS